MRSLNDPILFWAKVDIRKQDECWEWLSYRNKKGYGQVRNRLATHIALQLDGRPRFNGLLALHSCDNPPCVNPAHLRWGTSQENVDDMISRRGHINSNKSHCRKGHPLSGANLYMRKGRNERSCRACMAEHTKKYRTKKRANKDLIHGDLRG